MTSRQGEEYDLTRFDVDNYWIVTQRATAATYLPLPESRG